MKFALVKISGKRALDHSYAYSSTIMEQGASRKWTVVFESEYEMIATINGILSNQKKPSDVRTVINKIRPGEFYFFDLELTNQQAQALGWTPSPQGPVSDLERD